LEGQQRRETKEKKKIDNEGRGPSLEVLAKVIGEGKATISKVKEWKKEYRKEQGPGISDKDPRSRWPSQVKNPGKGQGGLDKQVTCDSEQKN